MSREFTREEVNQISTSSVSQNLMLMSLKQLNHSLRMQEYRLEFDTSDGNDYRRFNFQIINSLLESWVVRLTSLARKIA